MDGTIKFSHKCELDFLKLHDFHSKRIVMEFELNNRKT